MWLLVWALLEETINRSSGGAREESGSVEDEWKRTCHMKEEKVLGGKKNSSIT